MDVWREYKAAKVAVDRLIREVSATPDLLKGDLDARKYLPDASRNLEGTYIVRLFAAFESAPRSFDRARHNDPTRQAPAAAMIDEIGGRRGRGIPTGTRDQAHEVRRVRNFWAHDSDAAPGPMGIDAARSRLQKFLRELPDEWG